MITPERWPLVIGVALALVAVVGVGQILLTGEGGFAWVIVAVSAVSAGAAFAVARAQRRHDG